jgi:hypothetical protein
MIGFSSLLLIALGKNILSNILPIPTVILKTEISTPVIMGENQVPNMVPTVK